MNIDNPFVEEEPRLRIELASPAFEDGGTLPAGFGRDTGNVSPPLTWSGVPEDTVELVLFCHDVDAPGGPFVHWAVAGIHPSTTGVAEGVGIPAGAVASANDFGEPGWSGPAPPRGRGPHRYVFTLHASPLPLRLPPGATADEMREALMGKETARGELLATFER